MFLLKGNVRYDIFTLQIPCYRVGIRVIDALVGGQSLYFFLTDSIPFLIKSKILNPFSFENF